MKQVLQDLSTGKTELVTAPKPRLSAGHLLIDTRCSLISAGTERMLVEFGKAGLVQKARQQPDKVKQVLNKVQTDGLLTTVDAVRSKLGQPIPLGYCNVGAVHALGEGVSGFKPGDRVVSNGPHADIVRVPVNLCAHVPENVSDKAASFTVLGSIGLQGVRLAEPTLGETFVVTGVGLIGLLVVQLLIANGCRVLAIDFDDQKLALARQYGARTCNPGNGEDPIAFSLDISQNAGVDGVIIAASTQSNEPVTQAAQMCRKRGRIVLVGVVGLELNRADFYEKELTFQVSCSYGPGRYDPLYEEAGQDYPRPFVRWTQQRNFEAVLELLSTGKITVDELITHEFEFDAAVNAYSALSEDPKALGILLQYSHGVEQRHIESVDLNSEVAARVVSSKEPVVGVVGSGNYASRILIPAFAAAGVQLHSIASSGGTNSVISGQKMGFAVATSDTESLITGSETNTVVIATRHDTHAAMTVDALAAGKHVFVEKPLALTVDELALVEKAYASANGHLMVGFNRRFAPLVQKMKSLLDVVTEPKSIIMVMNAGEVPPDHWTQDLAVGGGRIIGEACHHIDLMRYLVGAEIVSVQARRMGDSSTTSVTEDKCVVVLGFADGSFGTMHYLANGSAVFPKERIEVFSAGATLQLDNFLKLKGFGWKGFRNSRSMRQDKGQTSCVAAFADAIRHGTSEPIPSAELFEVARVTLEATEQLRAQ
ncbi:MAG: bi-domain-containing oxidoreductase [Granulosicoccus sp.]|nr:bi-domain-containing oxidoreductase [Granulosicoccus sp.]